jgi:hypothetical protein
MNRRRIDAFQRPAFFGSFSEKGSNRGFARIDLTARQADSSGFATICSTGSSGVEATTQRNHSKNSERFHMGIIRRAKTMKRMRRTKLAPSMDVDADE